MNELIRILEKVNDYIDWENERNIFTDGLIDSMELLEIITDIEEQFKVKMDMEDISSENFDSIDAMMKLIERKRNEIDC